MELTGTLLLCLDDVPDCNSKERTEAEGYALELLVNVHFRFDKWSWVLVNEIADTGR